MRSKDAGGVGGLGRGGGGDLEQRIEGLRQTMQRFATVGQVLVYMYMYMCVNMYICVCVCVGLCVCMHIKANYAVFCYRWAGV